MNELAKQEPQQLSRQIDNELSVEQVVAHVGKIQEVMKKAMKDEHHYGVIPGTKKPTLLKPGAELLCMMFRLDPQYEAQATRERDHVSYVSTCTLYHIPTGNRVASGMGSCSTRESRYAYRQGARLCPACGKDTIIKGKAEYGGGWLCYQKKGGCGAKFGDKDQAIVGQETGRIANPDIADIENTVLKMANKRSLIAATLNATACSDIFTQDLEDGAPAEDERPVERPAVPAGMKRGSDLPESPPQDEPDDLDSYPSVTAVPVEVAKSSTRKGFIVVKADGKDYFTKVQSVGAKCLSHKQNNKPLRIVFDPGPNGNDIVSVHGEVAVPT